LKVTVCPAAGAEGENVNDARGDLSFIVTDDVLWPVEPLLSVAVMVMVNAFDRELPVFA